METLNKQKFKSPRAAYMGYLFQTFFKRPFGYIIAILYIVYLSVILVIVPAALKFEPLFIWNIGGFNMPIFNLFFIAGSAASIAVAVFRTGRDDGSDLNISAKPLTKNSTVLLKTSVYLLIMLFICLLTTAIVSLVKPIFGTYNEVTNITGITNEKYRGLVLSVLVGNIVNMLFFGGISVFISMVGGQVITIIGTVAIVFVMCLMNFLFPQILKSSIDVLSEKYDTEILSYSCNTVAQHNDPDAEPLNFATIQCLTDDEGDEEYHYDTKEYWDIAEREAGRKSVNYIDFGKQLSSLYSAFGLDESKLQEASKLVIGVNNSYNYNIDKKTHVSDEENVELGNCPISYYKMIKRQGKEYPRVYIIGGDMSISTSNWYLYSTLYQLDFASINYVSLESDGMSMTKNLWEVYANKPWNRMRDLILDDRQQEVAEQLYETAISGYDPHDTEIEFESYTHDIIAAATSDIIPGKTWADLSPAEKYNYVASIHLAWAIMAQQDQSNAINEYWIIEGEPAKFPYTSRQVIDWSQDIDSEEEDSYYNRNAFNLNLFESGIAITETTDLVQHYSRLVTADMDYAETYGNLYQYSVSNFYKINNIIAIWTVISCCLFTGSVIVYKRTDFK